MLDRAHVEEYFKTEQKRDNRTSAGWRIEEVKYYRVVAESLRFDRRLVLREEFSNSAIAKAYCAGWNKCVMELENEIERERLVKE